MLIFRAWATCDSTSHNWGICMRIPGTISALVIENAVTRNKPCTRNQFASEWVKKISKGLSTENYIIQIILYILSFNYCYRYEINLPWIMNAANSLILHSKEKKWLDTGLLTSILSECFWPPLFQTNWISGRIYEFSDNLTSLSNFTLNITQFL